MLRKEIFMEFEITDNNVFKDTGIKKDIFDKNPERTLSKPSYGDVLDDFVSPAEKSLIRKDNWQEIETLYSEKTKNTYEERVKPFLYQISIMMGNGYTLKQIWEWLGVAPHTFSKMREYFPELEKALTVGQDTAIDVVTNALFKKATGYVYKETKRKKTPKGETFEENTKIMHPDVQAIIFFLINRDSGNWKKNIDTTALANNLAMNTNLNVSQDQIKSIVDKFDKQFIGGVNVEESDLSSETDDPISFIERDS